MTITKNELKYISVENLAGLLTLIPAGWHGYTSSGSHVLDRGTAYHTLFQKRRLGLGPPSSLFQRRPMKPLPPLSLRGATRRSNLVLVNEKAGFPLTKCRSNKYFQTLFTLFITSVLPLFETGCSLIPPPSPGRVNAVSEDPIRSTSVWDPDSKEQRKANPEVIGLLVYTDSVSQFAFTVCGLGYTNWYVCDFKIIAPITNDLDENEIAFVRPDSWPFPGTGIMVNKPVFPYVKGKIFFFAIKNKNKPYKIIYEEERSVIAPYGPKKHPDWQTINYKQIHDALPPYYKYLKDELGNRGVEEETDQYWIMSIGLRDNPILLMIDRKTLTVKPVPLPEFRKGKNAAPSDMEKANNP